MSISADDVRAIARLARLELSDEEVARLQTELSTILGVWYDADGDGVSSARTE